MLPCISFLIDLLDVVKCQTLFYWFKILKKDDFESEIRKKKDGEQNAVVAHSVLTFQSVLITVSTNYP